MKKIILYIAASLDGRIAEPDGSLDWLTGFPNPEKINYGYKDLLASVDTVIMGGKTYRELLNMDVIWPYPNQNTYASCILGSYQQELMEQYKTPFQIIPEVKMLYNPQSKSAYNFVPGVMGLVLILICAMMTSIAIVREKEMGTMEVLLSSPMKPIYIILAKAVPYFTLSVANLVTILLLSVYVLGVPIAGSPFWLVVVSVISLWRNSRARASIS